MELTSHTINETKYEPSHLFDNILNKIKSGVNWLSIYDSFEAYYYVLTKAINFYENVEDFEACSIIQQNLNLWVGKIPKNTNEAIQFLINSTPNTHAHLIEDRSTFSLAINMHRTTGMRIIDLWILKFEESPLRIYYETEHKISNADQIANDILIKYIEGMKAKMETKL